MIVGEILSFMKSLEYEILSRMKLMNQFQNW